MVRLRLLRHQDIRQGKLIISRPGCSQTLSFLLSKIEDLVSEINNIGQWEESKAEQIF
jgi:hypothetical protein